MKISRKQSIFIAVTILMLFFCAVSILRPKNRQIPLASSQQLSDAAQNSQNGVLSSDFVLDDFKREEIKDGKKVWEVRATRGRYNPTNGSAALENANVWLYRKDGTLITLKADQVKLKIEGATNLELADFVGNVVIVQDNKMQLKTDFATYNKVEDLITAPNLVQIVGENMNLEGIGMEVTVSSKNLKLLKQVKTYFEPKSSTETTKKL